MNFKVLRRNDGPRIHIPVALIIDRSESTNDIRADLNKCIYELLEKMKHEETFRKAVDLLVVFFDSDYECILDFVPLDDVRPEDVSIVKSSGFTSTGRALLYVLERLDEKKIEWKKSAEKYYQPLVFLLTDGYPDAGYGAPRGVVEKINEDYKMAASEIRQREDDNKITFISAGIEREDGVSADIKRLEELTHYKDRVFRLCKDTPTSGIERIDDFFKLIYESTSATFTHTPIDDVIGGIVNL